MIARHNLVKKMIGLSIFQTSIFYLYISMSKVAGGTAPILLELPSHGGHEEKGSSALEQGAADTVETVSASVQSLVSPSVSAVDSVIYSNPLPHVLILTAIVVGVATTSVGLALIVRINEAYGSIEEDDIRAMEQKDSA